VPWLQRMVVERHVSEKSLVEPRGQVPRDKLGRADSCRPLKVHRRKLMCGLGHVLAVYVQVNGTTDAPFDLLPLGDEGRDHVVPLFASNFTRGPQHLPQFASTTRAGPE